MRRSILLSGMVDGGGNNDDDNNVYDYRGIEFTLVVQMFYPFSLQTHPHSFPGETNENVLNTRDVQLTLDTIRNDQLQ